MYKDSFKFGTGTFVGDVLRQPHAFDDPRQLAGQLAFRIGCPIPEQLIEDRGAEAMVGRYAEVAFWGNQIQKVVERTNPELFSQLAIPVKRAKHELPGRFDAPAVVPVMTYNHEIPPMETLPLYGASRLFIKFLDKASAPGEIAQQRLKLGLNILEAEAILSTDPADFTARVAESLVEDGDIEPFEAIKTIMPAGWLELQNAGGMVEDMQYAMRYNAPEIWSHYRQLSAADKAVHGIL